MPTPSEGQTTPPAADRPAGPSLRIGVDVGGTFTDLVALDPDTGALKVVKVPSTPPNFHLAVIEAVGRATAGGAGADVVHGSTVATNALLQRAGEPVAFVTTEGFRDMLLIGRQNRPKLYALRVERPPPLTAAENWFTVRERIDAAGRIVEPLDPAEVDALVGRIVAAGLRHVAVCLLFSFVNPAHEQLIGDRCARAGLTVNLSSDILPAFREYERASTTVINASLRPTVKAYLEALEWGLRFVPATQVLPGRLSPDAGDAGVAHSEDRAPSVRATQASPLHILHSGGGTLTVPEAAAAAARLVLSGPAGGVLGAALVARAAGLDDVVTYDMGGTSTDVATVVAGRPQWTTSSTVDGLPIGLPAFDIHTVGAGGGSIAYLDAGGALRVGPRSAGALPGPACYGRGGTEPTVTDANVVLGRIVVEGFAGGAVRIDPDLARQIIEPLAARMGKTPEDASLGIVRVAEDNMGHAVRAVTSRRGLDPRRFTLVSFGGAGGLHACAVAESLDIGRVLVPLYCGVLSALGMVAAAPVAEASRTVVHLADQLDDARIAAEYSFLSGQTMRQVGFEQTATVEAYADARLRGQSHELTVPVSRPSREAIATQFHAAYERLYGSVPAGRAVEVVTLRLRRIGRSPDLQLPPLQAAGGGPSRTTDLTDSAHARRAVRVFSRAELLASGAVPGPVLVLDPEATAYVPQHWTASCLENGSVLLGRA